MIVGVVICAVSLVGTIGPAAANQARKDQPKPVQQHRAKQKQAKPQPRVVAKPARLPKERQQQLIDQQRGRWSQYRENLQQQERLAQQRSDALRQQKRLAHYRFQQRYLERLRQQRTYVIRYERSYPYYRDPYFYTAPSYRYIRGGTYYETNRYGADLLRQAVNNGYAAGYEAGRADREDRWGNGYEDSFVWQDANYGYRGYYVDQSEYNYYFREGFRRGYEDGYNGHHHHGSYSKGKYIVLASVLAAILVFEALDS
jgi:hypothetical protein